MLDIRPDKDSVSSLLTLVENHRESWAKSQKRQKLAALKMKQEMKQALAETEALVKRRNEQNSKATH